MSTSIQVKILLRLEKIEKLYSINNILSSERMEKGESKGLLMIAEQISFCLSFSLSKAVIDSTWRICYTVIAVKEMNKCLQFQCFVE